MLQKTKRRLVATAGSGVLLTTLCFTLPGFAGAADSAAGCPASSGTIPVEKVEGKHLDVDTCDLTGRVITAGLAGVRVPEAGAEISSFIDTVDGGQSLTVAVAKTGELTVKESSDLDGHLPDHPQGATSQPGPVAAGTAAAANPPDCNDREQPGEVGVRRANGSEYFYLGNVAAGVNASDVENILGQVTSTFNGLWNGCGIPDQSDLDLRYAGRTDRWANVTPDGKVCDGLDDVNVIAFQTLSSGALAATCRLVVNGKITWDVAVNWDQPWWTTGGCNNGYQLKTVLTHEIGHAENLSHVGGASQVMYPYAGLCEERNQLGWGEATKLNDLY